MTNILAQKDLDYVFSLKGEQITKSPISDLITYSEISLNGESKLYYIKKYYQAGKHLRKYLGRSRLRAEYENLKFFAKLKIPTPVIINFIEDRNFIRFNKGVLITEQIKDVYSLADLAENKKEIFKNKTWLNKVIRQLASYTRKIHNHNFIHNDLKWRNILVTLDLSNPKVYFIDCPCGSKKIGPLLARGKIKDLACLDKVAKYVLDGKTRLKFYKKYLGLDNNEKLSDENKKNIIKILKFFENRE